MSQEITRLSPNFWLLLSLRAANGCFKCRPFTIQREWETKFKDRTTKPNQWTAKCTFCSTNNPRLKRPGSQMVKFQRPPGFLLSTMIVTGPCSNERKRLKVMSKSNLWLPPFVMKTDLKYEHYPAKFAWNGVWVAFTQCSHTDRKALKATEISWSREQNTREEAFLVCLCFVSTGA